MLRCAKCQRPVTIDELTVDRKAKGGHRHHCKICDNKRTRARYAADPGRYRAARNAWYKKDRQENGPKNFNNVRVAIDTLRGVSKWH